MYSSCFVGGTNNRLCLKGLKKLKVNRKKKKRFTQTVDKIKKKKMKKFVFSSLFFF